MADEGSTGNVGQQNFVIKIVNGVFGVISL